MKIKFRMKNEKNVKIIAVDEKTKEEHQIGHIFTPSGSGEDVKNAIQVCGFTEAFDLWGCAVFKTLKIDQKGLFILDEKGNKIYEQTKDIQLKFDMETKNGMIHGGLKVNVPEFVERPLSKSVMTVDYVKTTRQEDICYGCYNYPCTCEVKVKHRNPYMVKRQQDLITQKVKKKE